MALAGVKKSGATSLRPRGTTDAHSIAGRARALRYSNSINLSATGLKLLVNARSEYREDLRCFLLQQPSGPIQDTSTLSPLLAAVWASFDGSSAHQTTADKLHRMKSCQWTPPARSDSSSNAMAAR